MPLGVIMRKLTLHATAVQVDVDSVIHGMVFTDSETNQIVVDSVDLANAVLLKLAENGILRWCPISLMLAHACYSTIPDFSGVVCRYAGLIPLGKTLDQAFIDANINNPDRCKKHSFEPDAFV